MHRSRVGVVLIDVPDEHHDAALAFWAAALGRQPVPEGESTPYTALGPLGPVNLDVQRLGDATTSRIHVDIETDDVRAEIDRLVGLGATIAVRHESYATLRDPAGAVFCVVPVQTGEAFEAGATTWT